MERDEKIAKEIADNPNQLLKAIEETEQVLFEESFYERYKKFEGKFNNKF